jgi:hypothetical protein
MRAAKVTHDGASAELKEPSSRLLLAQIREPWQTALTGFPRFFILNTMYAI